MTRTHAASLGKGAEATAVGSALGVFMGILLGAVAGTVQGAVEGRHPDRDWRHSGLETAQVALRTAVTITVAKWVSAAVKKRQEAVKSSKKGRRKAVFSFRRSRHGEQSQTASLRQEQPDKVERQHFKVAPKHDKVERKHDKIEPRAHRRSPLGLHHDRLLTARPSPSPTRKWHQVVDKAIEDRQRLKSDEQTMSGRYKAAKRGLHKARPRQPRV